jgi:hypothetical protein
MKNKSPQNGKGSKRRPENFKNVQLRWDKINWGTRRKTISKPKCDCHNHFHRVCDICQGPTGKDKS